MYYWENLTCGTGRSYNIYQYRLVPAISDRYLNEIWRQNAYNKSHYSR